MRTYVLIVIISLFASPLVANTLIVRHAPAEAPNDIRYKYYLAVLKLALDKTMPSHGAYKIGPIEQGMLQERAMAQLQQGNIDVLWTMTSIRRERLLSPIRIPLTKGLLSHRLLIIRREDQQRFSTIKTLRQLRQFTAGQGHDWPDLKILRHNKLTTVSSSSYTGLFGMLLRRRFDYFPRGLHEPWQELAAQASNKLVIEPHLLLQYPAPIYFFFRSNDRALKERVELGLHLALDDGSFNRLLYNDPTIAQALANTNIASRTIIRLRNPLLSKRSLAVTKEQHLWHVVGEESMYHRK